MLWQNAPSVIIGRNQNAYAEVDHCFAKEHGIRIARRITGGGAVYHDSGNVNYSFISPAEKEGTLDFEAFSAPILNALSSLGIHASLSGRNDIEVDGKKISGNAQHRVGHRLLHHGTLLFAVDTATLEAVLRPNREKLKARAIRSVSARVTDLRSYLPTDMTVEGLIDHLCRYVENAFHTQRILPPTNEEIDALARRNASRAWIYPEKDLLSRYTKVKERRYPFGSVELLLEMKNDKIFEIAIKGDFFGIRPISELEDALRGARLCEVETRLSSFDIGAYVCGMQKKELTELLCAE